MEAAAARGTQVPTVVQNITHNHDLARPSAATKGNEATRQQGTGVVTEELARAETIKQMIVTLSHYIMNPLTAINLGTYELTTKQAQGQVTSADDSLKRNLQLIEMNIKEIAAVIAILQQLASPKRTTYVGSIEMIDIEDEVRDRVRKIRAEYPEIDHLLQAAT